MVSLMSDARVAFLIWFVGIAIVFAVFLIILEIRLKKLRDERELKMKEKTPIDRLRIFLSGQAKPRDKLDAIGKTAKEFFKMKYNLDENLDYGELRKAFDSSGRFLEASFCEEMFDAYYSNHDLTVHKIMKLFDMLNEIYLTRDVLRRVMAAPTFDDRVDMAFEGFRKPFSRKILDYVNSRNEKLARNARVAARQEYELVSWVRNAIRMGYDKVNIFNILSEGNTSKKEVKKVLKVYEKEAVKLKGNKGTIDFYGSNGGVAKRIVDKEKGRLENSGAFAR